MSCSELNINNVGQSLIESAGESFVNSGRFTPEIQHSLYLIYGKTLSSALGLLDNKKVGLMS